MGDIFSALIGGVSNLIGSSMNTSAQEQINQQNIAEQEKFAQQGVQWKVADAKAAGINPLAALGAQTSSFSNVVAPQPGTGVAAAGQDLSRAISATRDPEARAAAVEKTRLDLESSQLDNDLKKAQLASSVARTTGASVGPPMAIRPDPGKGGTSELHTVEGPSGPITGPSRATEGWAWLDPIAKEQYFVRNQLMPWFGYNIPREEQQLAGPGAVLAKNPFTGSYYDTRQYDPRNVDLSGGGLPSASPW